VSYVTPLKDKILVKYRERKQGLVYIPDSVEEKERVADVLAVGDQVKNIKKGDVVKVFEGVEGFSDNRGNNFLTENLIMGKLDGDMPIPMADRLLVLPDVHPEKIGSIIIPDTAKKKVLNGTVVAVGPGKALEDGTLLGMEVKKGDRVGYHEFAGGYDGFEINGTPHLSMREEDVLFIWEE
jgi:chaperonin GroES